MTASPFTYMASALTRAAFPAAPPVRQLRQAGTTRTESIRQLLRETTRPLTAAEIAFDLDLPSSCTVWLLMKYDMQKGRVLLSDGSYRWNHEYDHQEAEELREAVKLLKKHGYRVEK